jgi:hypothetical protein
MDHFTIAQTLNRVADLSAKLNYIGQSQSSLPASTVQQHLTTLAECVNHVAGVLLRITDKQRMMADEGGLQF